VSPQWADPTRPHASKLALAIAKALERKGYLCIPPEQRGWGLAKWNTDSVAEVIEMMLKTDLPQENRPQEGKE